MSGQQGQIQLDKLVERNLRLENELLFANKCIKTLIIFKSYVNFICNKYKNNLTPKEWELFEKYLKDVQEVFKSKDKLNEQITKLLTQKLHSSEDVIDIEEDNGGTSPVMLLWMHPMSSNSALQQSMNPSNKNSAQNEINSNNGNKIIGNIIHSTDESKKTSIETKNSGKEMPLYERLFKSNIMNDKLAKNEIKSYDGINSNKSIHSSEDYMNTKKTLLSHKELPSKPLYKSNITYNRKRKKSNNCSQNIDKSVNNSIETTEKMTDPTTTQITKTEIISNDKTEENSENIKFEYLSQNLKDFEKTYNLLNSSESQFSTKDPKNEQNISFVDTNDSEEQTISSLKDREKKLYKINHELEGPVIVNIKPSNSSTEQKINSVFKCPIIGCNKWMTIDFIPKHSLEIHNQFVIICGQNRCKKVFTSAVKYDEHMIKHKKKDKQWLQYLQDLKNCFICDQNDCHKDFTSEEELLLHKREIHFVSKIESEVTNISNNTSPVIMCSREDCLQSFKEKLFTHHMIVFHKECTSVECLFPDCSEKFNDFEEYMNHLLSHSSDFWYKYYPKIYYDLKVYKKHFITDKNDSNKCNICGKVFGDKKGLNQHKKGMHIVKPNFDCDYPGCGKKFKYQSLLNAHKRTVHSSVDRKHECNQCNGVFKHKLALYYHKKSVHKEKLECSWPGCQFTSRGKYRMERHEASHRPDRNYMCDWPECGKAYKSMQYLRQHMKIHTRTEILDKKYSCEWPGCEFRTAYSRNMSAHMKAIHRSKKHIGEHQKSDKLEKIYVCEWPGCHYSTFTKSSLKLHRPVHCSERKYVCDWPECGKAYKHISSYNQHMNTHTNDMRCSCDYPGCSFHTGSSGTLSKHKRKHRKKNVNDPV